MQADEQRIRKNLRDNFPLYAKKCLKIRPKKGGMIPLVLNNVQKIIHLAVEKQLRETGRVRILLLKPRQPGCSTYVEGRFYWKVTHRRGMRAYIVTHRQEASDNLFSMVARFHDHCPELVKPVTGVESASHLSFVGLDCDYKVGTAGAAEIGRSDTIQYFHGSEVAFWANAEAHFSGVMQAVPNAEGTEVVLESTANGVGGLFYNMCKAAERGDEEYRIVFIPWFTHDEYDDEPPPNWEAPPAFSDYGEMHDLTERQLYWAWRQNSMQAAAEGLSSDSICWRFRQEYPATAEEAFRASREGSFINGDIVLRARRTNAPDQDHAPIILGCDFATGGDGEGGDSNCFIDRQGRALGRHVYDRFRDGNTLSVAGKLGRVVDKLQPAMCFLDRGGGGAAVYDILVGRGYGKVLTLVDFGSSPYDNRRYLNKRAEMWGDFRDWLQDPGGADIPDDDALDGDLTSVTAKEDMHQRIVLAKKDDIRKLLGFSPDGGDASVLTVAEPVLLEEDWREHDDPHADSGRSEIAGY